LGIKGGGLPVVTHKTELDVVDGTPEKRFFLSLISDYDLKTGLCELVDNAIDFWTNAGSTGRLSVEVVLDPTRQVLCVSDDAGGVRRENVRTVLHSAGHRIYLLPGLVRIEQLNALSDDFGPSSQILLIDGAGMIDHEGHDA
jgi:hypothetical protein